MSQTRAGFSYPKGVFFQCTRCALCCGNTRNRTRHILLLRKDAQTISSATRKPIKSFATGVRNSEPYVYEMRKTLENGKCLYVKGTDCSIYELRPLVCRFYPFELRTTNDGKHRFLCTGECPAVGKGRKLEKNYFQDLFIRAREQLGTKKAR